MKSSLCLCGDGAPHKVSRHVTRCFHRYSHVERADRSASHRLGFRQREAVGEHFYVSDLIPGIAYPSRSRAEWATIQTIEATEP